ncbi:DUF971 family protein [Acinetobacter calcoaceticus]|uniref:DUF971 family protein n=1 Tax=Acinetobacter calcoaceticus TaxID=471 RepID=A0A4R1XC29_ACICA|nr:DUF971 family protein [Acinetobacter calcoaceticus]
MHIKPANIQFDVENQLIHFIWDIEEMTTLSYMQLRNLCPCVFCRYNKIKNLPISIQENIQVTQLNHQGYGVQICFSDGHDRGIYPWEYLMSINNRN